jgi:hypothetical protein
MGCRNVYISAADSAATNHKLVQWILLHRHGDHTHRGVGGSNAQMGAVINTHPPDPVCDAFAPGVDSNSRVIDAIHFEVHEPYDACRPATAMAGIAMMPMCMLRVYEGVLAVGQGSQTNMRVNVVVCIPPPN